MSRSALRPIALLVLLALLLPLVAVAESCDDCLETAQTGCCPPSCCPCCLQISPSLTGFLPSDPISVDLGRATEPAANRPQSSDPRDVFHVPKSLLA
jgi:hypothetical protein